MAVKRHWTYTALLALFCLAGCGFHLQGSLVIPPSLKTLYLTSNDPYGQFSQQFRQSLRSANVKLVNSADQAPYTLAILSSDQSIQQIGTGQSQQTRSYNLVYTVSYSLQNAQGMTIFGPSTVTATENFSLPPEVLVDNSPQLPSLRQQAEMSAMQHILDQLSSENVREAIKQYSASTNDENQSNTAQQPSRQ